MKLPHRYAVLFVIAVIQLVAGSTASHAYVLIADRSQNRVVKYDDNGAFVGVVLTDAANLGGQGRFSGPSALALSPDGTKLYVASLNSSIVRYDFDGTTGTNPQKYVSNGQSSINDPGGVIVSPDGAIVYVANRGFGFSDAVARLNPDGTSQGADLGGGGNTGRTGLAFGPGGQLLAGTFGTDLMGGGPGGGVVRFDSGSSSFVSLVPESQATSGVANLLVNGNDLYLTASVGPDFEGRIAKYNLSGNTATLDPNFGVGGLVKPEVSFPTGLTNTADGTGFLVSMLTLTQENASRIDRYLFDGTRVDAWAENSSANPALGFVEATALLHVAPVPEPSTLAGATVLAIGWVVRRRATRRR